MSRKAVSSVVLVLLVTSLLSVGFKIQTAKADVDWWPTSQHDLSRSGYSTSLAPNTATLLWQGSIENEIRYGTSTGVVTYNGMVIATDRGTYVDSIYEGTGALCWRQSLTGSGDILATPSTDGNLVYVVTRGSATLQAAIHALSFADGHQVWVQNIGPGGNNYFESPAISPSRNMVVVGSTCAPAPSPAGPATVWAFNKDTGGVLWHYGVTLGAFYSSASIDETNNKVFIASGFSDQLPNNVGKMYCLDLQSGNLLYSYAFGNSRTATTTPTIYNGKLYYAYVPTQYIYCFDENLNLQWNAHVTGVINYMCGIAVAYGKVFTGSDCLDASNGNLIWHSTAAPGGWSASPAVADGKMYLENSNPYGFSCYDANSGTLIWNYARNGMLYGTPAISNGKAFFTADSAGGLFAFQDLPYSVTIAAHCNTESSDINVPIKEDGQITGFDTPHPFTGLLGTHNFTVLDKDFDNHAIWYWDASIPGQNSPTISVSGAGTHTAYYQALPYQPTNVKATPLNLGISLTWSPPSNLPGGFTVQSYNIYRDVTPDFPIPWLLPYRVVYAANQFQDSIQDNSIYYYRVAANFQQGLGNPSSPVSCARLESLKGICNVVTLNDFQTKDARDSKLPSMFSIQQNFEVPLKFDTYGNLIDYYWIQNIVYVDCAYDRSQNLMGGGMQIWRYTFDGTNWQGQKDPADCYPKWINGHCLPQFGRFSNTVTLVSEIDNNNIFMENNLCSHTFTLANPYSADLHIGLYPNSNTIPGAARSPEIAIVGYGVGLGSNPNVDFVDKTDGSVDSSFLLGTSWRQSRNVQPIPIYETSCLETSTGLQWNAASGTFNYDSSHTDGYSQDGFWYEPVFGAAHSAPSISPSSSASAIVFSAACPVYLDLYDDQGNCVGFNQTSGIVNFQIANAFWISNQTLLVFDPSASYRLEVTGTDNGTYEMEVSWQDITGTTITMLYSNSTISENETQVYDVGAEANVVPMNILSSKTIVGQGFGMQVNATVANLGGPNATCDVVFYANNTAIGTQSALNISGWDSIIASSACNTTGLAYGNYTLWTCTADSNCTGGVVLVTIPGDINGDSKVNLVDLVLLANAYGSHPGDTRWSPNADINSNNAVDLTDLVVMANHYGQQLS